MIISRTPFRISFFGGGTDYPIWYEKHGGKVINATIDKYCFITVRYLPPFFKYKHRIRYYKHEEIKDINEIKQYLLSGISGSQRTTKSFPFKP